MTTFPVVISGVNALENLGEQTAKLGLKRVLLVTDAGLVSAGHATRAEHILQEAEISTTLFADARENPTTGDIESCLNAARTAKVDGFVAVGGGSVIDTAKAANFLLTNGGAMEDYQGKNKTHSPLLPLIAVPTTAGTGSEMQSYALIARADTHAKMACGDDTAMAKVVILDPALTLTLPRKVTAHAGLDALVHALETLVTRVGTDPSRALSVEAFTLLHENLPRVLSNPGDLEAREAMLLGAARAGEAIERSMLGAAHGAANPLTAHFDIPHGAAVAMMLPHVIRFNGEHEQAQKRYCELADATSLFPDGDIPGSERIAQRVEELLDIAGVPRSPAAWGLTSDATASLAAEASGQWTACFNPRPVSAEDFVEIYGAALAASSS